MTTLHCIHEGDSQSTQNRLIRLAAACKALNVCFAIHNSLTTDCSDIEQLDRDDLVYNVARGSHFLESLFLNMPSTTFYIDKPLHASCEADASSIAIVYEAHKLSVPKSIFHKTCDRELLRKYVDALHGFPIVLKVAGGTLGVGAMLVSDLAALFSLTDYLMSIDARFFLRQYIFPREVARLIVVAERVVASNQKLIAEGDFRTTVKHRLPVSKAYPLQAQQLAIAATHAANRETAGVDILFDKDDRPYVLEVNMPHDFVTTEDVTGVDVAIAMVDHLKTKAHR